MRIFTLIIIFFTTSCSTFIRDNCSTESSAEVARKRASNWLDSEAETSAPNCAGNRHFGPSQFKDVYTQSYTDQLKLQCTKDYVSGQASLYNSDLVFNASLFEQLNKCKLIDISPKSLQEYYKANVAKLYCHKEKTIQFANKHAKNYRKANSDHLSYCYKKTRKSLDRLYTKVYKREISRMCSVVEITAKAINDVKIGKELVDGVQMLRHCPKKLREKALATYKESFYAEADRKEKQMN
jgi:hypothetical protein